jgi:4-amino-4-deoxy-L-arabinose transferase-like glycosyltransferase
MALKTPPRKVRVTKQTTDPPADDSVAKLACAALIAVAAVYWVWLAVAGRSITTDPAISVLAAQSILEHGYPRLPSGFIYDRAYVPNYSLALMIELFGLNDLSVAIPSLIVGLASLYVTYRIGRDILRRPWLGVAAVALLLGLEINSHYAASPRMYMSLQFFTILAVYSAWRGHVEDDARFRVLTFAAVAAACLTHQQGGMLTFAIPLAVLTVLWLRRGRAPSVQDVRRLVPLVLLAVPVVFMLFYEIPGSMEPIAMRTMPGGLSGLNLRPRRWVAHANWLEHTVPLGIFLAPAVVGLAVRAVRGGHRPTDLGVLYLLMLFGLWAAGVFGYIRVEGVRFWVAVAPLYILLLFQSVSVLTRKVPASTPLLRRPAVVWGAVLVAWAGAVVLGYSRYYGPGVFEAIVREGYGVPCSGADPGCSVRIEAEYRALGRELGDSDVIVSTNPFVANYYLGHVDGWLVQRQVGSDLVAFDAPKDEYFGVDLVDRPSDLMDLKRAQRRVWVIVEDEGGLDPSLMSSLKQGYYRYDDEGPLSVYVSTMVNE